MAATAGADFAFAWGGLDWFGCVGDEEIGVMYPLTR